MIIYIVGCIISLVLLLYFTREEESFSVFTLIALLIITAVSWVGVALILITKLQEWATQTDLWDRIVDFEIKNPFHKK